MGQLGNILGIWAHPDDETYLAAGVMMRAVAAGHGVTCVTATRGEQGTTDPQRWPPGAALAQVRTRESEAAMSILGVSDHEWLDYPDGGVAEVDPEEAVARIMTLAQPVRPDVITTFGPGGMTGHTDHQAVSRWADEVARRLDPSPRVLHAVHVDSLMDRHLPRMLELGIFMNGAMPDTAPDDAAVTLRLTQDEFDRKWSALTVQESQTAALFAIAGADLVADLFRQESFIEADGTYRSRRQE